MSDDLRLRVASRKFIEGVVKKPEQETRAKTFARIGMVTGTAPFTVEVAGGPVQASKLASYTPAVGDRVLLLSTGGDLVALGAIG